MPLIGAGMVLQFKITKSHFISVTLKREQGLDFVEDGLLCWNEVVNELVVSPEWVQLREELKRKRRLISCCEHWLLLDWSFYLAHRLMMGVQGSRMNTGSGARCRNPRPFVNALCETLSCSQGHLWMILSPPCPHFPYISHWLLEQLLDGREWVLGWSRIFNCAITLCVSLTAALWKRSWIPGAFRGVHNLYHCINETLH